jgi:hypothetical protein
MNILTIVAAATTLAACATVTRGTTSQIQILSNPPEATARTSLGYSCLTPCTVQMSRKDEFTVVVSKPGYHSAEVFVRTQVAGSGAAGFAGNVILGGVVGMGVDAATGAALEHFPNPVLATLSPLRHGERPKVIKIEPRSPAPRHGELGVQAFAQ